MLESARISEVSIPLLDDDLGLCNEPHFARLLQLERRRTGRSSKPFMLMLLDVFSLLRNPLGVEALPHIGAALSSSFRETDLSGWFKQEAVIGVILTEIACIDEAVKDTILLKTRKALCETLGWERAREIDIALHVFPEEPGERQKPKTAERFDLVLYPDLARRNHSNRVPLVLKRAIDIAGSLLALAILSPIFLLVALSIKLTSKGPVLFKQKRLGLHGKEFTFLKFRSMHTNCGESKHKGYIKEFILEQKSASGPGNGPGNGGGNGDGDGGAETYKLKDDDRITPLGRFLRKTSLDEIPQFLNVLKGEMSLVGPRPPIPYELELYDIWHRRRLLGVKPGITGLWQVYGRSSTTFNDMVRMDIRYTREWSLWLDLKILFKTPWVVLTCKGAY
jgi:lipopolysaccharide/colanic/teichoic acid biosynthesis glycosyltransferase